MIRDDGTAKKLRRAFNIPGHSHELTFSCYKKLPLLSKDRTRLWFLDALDRARKQHDFAVWAYVIMPEHAHVLIFPRDKQYEISKILQSVKQPVSRRATDYLRAHSVEWLDRLKVVWPTGRFEHRFWQQGGGYDRNMFTPQAVWASIEYLHNNPIRRGLVSLAKDWPWSSASWYAGKRDGDFKMSYNQKLWMTQQ